MIVMIVILSISILSCAKFICVFNHFLHLQDSQRLCRDFLQPAGSFPQHFESFPLLPKPVEPLGQEPGAADGNGPLGETLGHVLATTTSSPTLQHPWREEERTRGDSGRLQCPREEVEDDRQAESFKEAQFWRGEVESGVWHPDQSARRGGEYPGCPQGWELSKIDLLKEHLI